MVTKVNTKSRRGFFRSFVSFISYLFLGVALIAVYQKAESVHNMEQSLNLKLKNIAFSEERIQKLHQQVHRALGSRHRREVVLNNDAADDELNDIKQRLEDGGVNTERPSCNVKCGTMGGAIYTRWGRKNCSDGSDLVYEGVVGGSHYDHTGGAVDHLCLPRFHVWNSYQNGDQSKAFLFGTEYQESLDALFSLKNARALHEENVPCAVCRSVSRQSAIMIPARNVCYQGWTLEYHGYLLAGHHAHKKGTMYICVDEAPEVTEGGYRDENGNLLYQVEGSCGSLPCPEYI